MALSALSALSALAALALSACGSGDEPTYDSERVAPLPSELSDTQSDVAPRAEEALAELDLDDGGTAALWIDPDDVARVYVQYSDPDDPGAWTEPALVFEGGDGCLTMDAVAAGGTVAVGLGCYAVDAFLQQAPDEGVALVSTDRTTWDEEAVGESIPVPEVSDDGSEVVFRNDVYDGEVDAEWRRGEGF